MHRDELQAATVAGIRGNGRDDAMAGLWNHPRMPPALAGLPVEGAENRRARRMPRLKAVSTRADNKAAILADSAATARIGSRPVASSAIVADNVIFK